METQNDSPLSPDSSALAPLSDISEVLAHVDIAGIEEKVYAHLLIAGGESGA